jgi:hypothetical protein
MSLFKTLVIHFQKSSTKIKIKIELDEFLNLNILTFESLSTTYHEFHMIKHT